MSTKVSTQALPSLPGCSGLWARFGTPLLLAGSRCAAVAVQFLLQIVVGSLAGPAGLGILQLFASWSCTFGEFLARGLPAWAMRQVAVETAKGDSAVVWPDLKWAVVKVLQLATAIVVAMLTLTAFFSDFLWSLMAEEYRLLTLAVLLGAPLFALVRLGAEALKGAGEPLHAITLENLLIPGCLLLVCVFCWIMGLPLDSALILGASCVALAVTLIALWKRLHSKLQPGAKTVAVDATQHGEVSDLKALWANSVMAIMFMQLPFLLLPWFASPEEIGIYAVAYKLLNIVTTLLVLLCAIFGPAFARAAADDDRQELRTLLRRTQWLSCVIFFPLCIVVLLAVAPLAELFNLPSAQLQTYLLILAAGQMVNAATGLSGVLLNMSGGAKLEMRTLLASLLLALVATPIVGPIFGVLGLAVLFSLVLAVKNVASYIAASMYLSKGVKIQ